MPRKAAAASTDAQTEPRRSSRIKEQPKSGPAPKKATKNRSKKVEKEEVEKAEDKDKEDKPKSARGRKRKVAEELNGVAAETGVHEGEEPAPKKAKPASKAKGTLSKPPSAAAAAKPSSKVSGKPASRAGSTKPSSRAESRKPASKAEGQSAEIAQPPKDVEPIAEEPEAEEQAEAAAAAAASDAPAETTAAAELTS